MKQLSKQKINYKNLIISSISIIVFGIILGITFNKISIYLTDLQIFLGIILSSILTVIGIITLFPVFEKEKKTKKKKKQSSFDRALKNKMR